MDKLQRAFFHLAAREKFGRLRREAFEGWFCEIMSKAHPTDFEAVRLAIGDGSLDGVLLSEAAAFQVYAPRDQQTNKIVGKIEHDFAAGKKYLSDRNVTMKKWVFVHNDEDGLAAKAVAALAKLKQDNPDVKIERWAFEMIWSTLKLLEDEQLIELFGPGPVETSVERLEVPEIIEVVAHLEREDPPPLADMTIPDPGKLEHNQLSVESEIWLQMGRLKVGLVQKCFDTLNDPTSAEKIAEAFRRKYADLRSGGLAADTIFSLLWEFAGGVDLVGQKQQAAIAAVMAYFFNACDIFENVPEAT